MKKGQSVTAFYVESLLLILVFVGILLALTQIFGLSRRESVQAKLLTNAVTLAQNAADDFLSGRDQLPREEGDDGRRYTADMAPDPDGRLLVRVQWAKQADMLEGTVSVYDEQEQQSEPLFTLPLARYVGEVSP